MMKKRLQMIIPCLFIWLLFTFNGYGQVYETNFEISDHWGSPDGGPMNGYNDKTYIQGGWFFGSSEAFRGDAAESFGGSDYSFRDRGDFHVMNLDPVNGVSGFSLQLRDWMLGSGVARDLNISYDGGDSWESIAVIDKGWFDEYQVYQEYMYIFPDGAQDFAAEDLQIELIGGNGANTSRINIGQFVALGEMDFVATPSFSPPGGSFYQPVDVNITTATPDADIHYSLVSDDGPWTDFEDPVTISETGTIWAYASAEGMEDSNVASADFVFPEVTAVSTLAELRDMPDDGTVYHFTGDAVIVAMDSFRNRKFIQDETAAILIDDQPGTISTEYDLYDVITDVIGQIDIWNDMVRFQPEVNTPPATENTPVDPVVFAIDDLTADDQSKLVQLINVSFVGLDEDEEFSNGTNYTITDGENEMIFRTDFWNVDYIGETIPDTPLNISGVIIQYQENMQIIARFAADMEDYEEEDPPDDVVDTFPWTEDFEEAWVADPDDPDAPVAPEGWTVVNGVDGSYWERSSVASYQGGFSARSYNGFASSNQADEWLITPPLNLDGEYGFLLSFFGYSSQAPDGTRENMRIMILDQLYDNAADLHAHATEIIVIPFTQNWEEYIVSLVDYSGIKYLAFNYYITAGMEAAFNWIYVDEVMVSEILEYDFVIGNLSGDLAVQAGTSAVYDIAVDNRGLEDDTYDITIAGGDWTYTFPASFAVEGGDIGTFELEVGVPADAGMGDVDTATLTVTSQGDSDKSHQLAISTSAIATISAPYFQDFDDVTAPALPLGWAKIVDHPTSTTAVVETYTFGTPLSPPNHVRLHSNQEEADIMLITPPIVGLSDNSLGFWARCNLASNIPDLIIGTMSDPADAETFTPFHTFEADEDLTNVYQFFIVDFTGYQGTDAYVAFKHGGTPNFFRSIYIDDVTLGVPYMLTVNINPEGAGTVSGDGLWFEDGEAPLSATASEGYIFYNWTDADDNVLVDDQGEPYGDSFTFTMPGEDVTLNANFLSTYQVTFTVEDAEENALQGVEITYDSEFQSGTLMTGADGTATVQLSDAMYTYTAYLIGYNEAAGDFTVAGDDLAVFITLSDADPILSVDPDPFDFGEVALNWTSDPQAFTLTNIGGDGLIINGVTLIDPDGQFVLTDDNDYTDGILLDTGESIAVDLAFAPTMEGMQSATLEIAYDDGNAQSHDVDITGMGVDITIVDFPWFEDFTDYPTGDVPPFWIRTHNNWAVWNTSNAGGEAPELRFNWSPSATSVFRAIPPPFDATDLTGLELTFKYMVNDYSGGYDLKVQVSLDGGDTWEDVWVLTINGDKDPQGATREGPSKGDVPATEATIDLADYDGEVFHIAFVYDGNSFNINQWYIDDIMMGADVSEQYQVTFHVVEDTADEDPIEGATITIGDLDSIHTDVDGMAMIHLEDGSYTAHVSKAGFSAVQADFTVDGEDKLVHVALTESDVPDDVVDDFPWVEDFEAPWVANPGYEESPEGWFVINGADGSYWEQTSIQTNSGQFAARSYQGFASDNLADEWMITPAFNLDNPEATQMLFHGYTNQAPDGVRENMRIMILDQVYDNVDDLHANATLIQVVPFTQTWEEYIVSLDGFSGVKHLAFNYYITPEDNATFNWIYVDDIIVGDFETYTLTMLAPDGNGTVVPAEGSYDFSEGTNVQLTATADYTWSFDRWEVDGEFYSDEASTTLTMDADKEVQAFFTAEDAWTLTMLAPEGNGSVTPDVGDHNYLDGDVVDLVATADMGYIFSHWTGDVDDPNSNATTILMDDDKTVQAHFVVFDGIDLPWTESFTGIPNGELPSNWTRDVNNWGVNNTSNAGGEAPEMRFNWSPAIEGRYYLTSPKINTAGHDALLLEFKNFVNNFSGPGLYTLSVVTIADGEEHIVHEWVDPSDIPAHEFEAILTASQHGVGTDDFYIAWVFDGDSYDINWWNFDDIFLGEAPDMYEVTFFVGEDNADQTPIEGAFIHIDGDTYHTDQDGVAVFMLVDDQTYTADVTASGYVAQEVTFTVDGADVSVDVLLMDHIIEPFNLSVITEDMEPGEALFIWNDYGDEYEFRYDDGVVDAQLGFQGTWNSVMGAVHFNDAILHEMTWYLTEEGGPHSTVKVWVLGLTPAGLPDRNNVVYTAENVPNTDNQWNTYEFAMPIEMPEGFFIGLSYNGFLGLAVDDGVGEPWDFVPGTQFGVFNITDPTSEFTDISFWGFEVNYLIRAYGNNLGELSRGTHAGGSPQGPAPQLIPLESPVEAGKPHFPQAGQKAFLGFNVYLNDEMVAQEIMETEYHFTGLPGGEHTAGVQSVYTTGSSDIVTIDFEVEGDEEPDTFQVSFHVDLTRAIQFGLLEGFDPEVHHIMITGDMVGWAEPGSDPENQVMEWLTADPMVFGITHHLEAGTYEYKYFSDLLGDGWDGGEWPGDPNRVVEVTGEMTVEDMFGPDDLDVLELDDIHVMLYPNPARSTLNIQASEQILTLRMVDMLGQVVLSQAVQDTHHQIEVSGYQTGVYFIQLTTRAGVITHRVQVTR